MKKLASPRALASAALPVFVAVLVAGLVAVLPAAPASATPATGTKELRIGQNLQPPLTLTNGFIRLEPEEGEGLSGMGLGGGLGYFVTDHIELGLSVDFQLLKSGNTTLSGPGATPFVRLMAMAGKVAYFAEFVAELQLMSSDNASTRLFSFGGDLGLELFVTEDWAVRVSPTFRHVITSQDISASGTQLSGEASGNRFGITWGLACYF
jgi:hypothetical protein